MTGDAYDKYCRHAPRRNEAKTWQTIEVGKRFRRGRLQAGLSQRTVAFRAGVSQSEVSRMERGMRPGMAVFRLAAIALALGPRFPFGTCPHDHRCAYSTGPEQPLKPWLHRSHQDDLADTPMARTDSENGANGLGKGG